MISSRFLCRPTRDTPPAKPPVTSPPSILALRRAGALSSPMLAVHETPTAYPKPRLLDRVRDAIRARHYSRRTEDAYVGWIRRYIFFHRKRRSAEMGAPQVASEGDRRGRRSGRRAAGDPPGPPGHQWQQERGGAASPNRTDYKTLYLKLKQYGIDAGRFRE